MFTRKGFTPDVNTLKNISILGVDAKPTTVTVNGDQATFQYDANLKVSENLNISIQRTVYAHNLLIHIFPHKEKSVK